MVLVKRNADDKNTLKELVAEVKGEEIVCFISFAEENSAIFLKYLLSKTLIELSKLLYFMKFK